ncbi:MAG: primosomal protein N' [Paludibacteraceae bacterium]|nr:primosomal protein N' [Paludibacteraceae bacterium]
MRLIDVILPLAIRDTYTYLVPDDMPNPQPGMRVLVPLAKKQLTGIVLRAHTEPLPETIHLRAIIALLDEQPAVGAGQLALWQWIAAYYMCPIGDVMAAALPARIYDKAYSFSPVKKRRVKLPAYPGEIEDIHPLSDVQQRAKQEIEQAWKTHETVLLHGVTASGKTEVYMHLIREQLEAGRQVLYLVPEIALTTQLTDRLQRVFGDQVVVYHSRVTDALRAEIYRQQLHPQSRLIVGARSAVLLPFDGLGLVIVDEEHETSYKQQDPAPRYHARSAAIMLAHQEGAKVLLGTATPSVETYYNARTGKYGLVELSQRYRDVALPKVELIDLERQYHRKEMYGHFSDPLVARMREVLAQGKQVILFQNRRGYAPQLQCTVCGQPPRCEHCDVPLTLHMQAKEMRCHYCGFTRAIPTVCPACGGPLKIRGFGTERLEDEVASLFPEARVLRMDLDTTRHKNDYQDIIDRFARHECDILIGTQMVTKGLHFDDVALVAVLSADHLMNQPDFRAYERCYQMLSQVAGRAGRKEQQGEVMIQTWQRDNGVLHHVLAHDYLSLYREQIAERELFHYPPFYRIIELTLRHSKETEAVRAARLLQQRLRGVFGDRVSDVIVPSVARIQNQHIRMVRLRVEVQANIRGAKERVAEQIAWVQQQSKSIQILADVDPQ